MKRTVLKVKGMSCNHCVMSVTEAVGSVPGVSEVNVDLDNSMVIIVHNENLDMNIIKRTIDELGYDIE